MKPERKNKKSYGKILESAAERLTAVLISQVEFNKNNLLSLKSPKGREKKLKT